MQGARQGFRAKEVNVSKISQCACGWDTMSARWQLLKVGFCPHTD